MEERLQDDNLKGWLNQLNHLSRARYQQRGHWSQAQIQSCTSGLAATIVVAS